MCCAGQEATAGGQEARPFEDTSVNASWTTTLGQLPPWDTEPIIAYMDMPVDPNVKQIFFGTIFTCGYQSILLYPRLLLQWNGWTVSHIRRLIMVDSRMEVLTQDFLAFLTEKENQPIPLRRLAETPFLVQRAKAR